MGRKIIVTSPAGQLPVLEEVMAHDEAQLQELLKAHPDLLPLEDLGLAAPALVVGRESVLDSGRIDLVLLAKWRRTGPRGVQDRSQNPDFRECLAQLLDYGSDLWGMSLEDFDTRVARKYFSGPHFPGMNCRRPHPWMLRPPPYGKADKPTPSLARAAAVATARRKLSPHRCRPALHRPVLRTVEYLNATMKAARFSAVELVRFSGEGYGAFECPVRCRRRSRSDLSRRLEGEPGRYRRFRGVGRR